MVYFNRSDEQFRPSGDRSSNGVWFRPEETAPQLEDGLYFRGRTFPELSNEVDLSKSGSVPWNRLTLDAYQAWNEVGWKEPHASVSAYRRFDKKMIEERNEVDNALEEYFDGEGPGHLVEELGDYAYVITAMTNLGGGVVSDGTSVRLFEYGKGTRVYQDNNVGFPDWYDTAMHIATKREPITIGDIDGLISEGFMPTWSPAKNLYPDEPECATGYVFDFHGYNAGMRSIIESQFDIDNDNEEAEYQIPIFWNQEVAERTGKIAAEVYFRTAYIAQYAGSSLADVISGNVVKIANRIKTRSVDRTDGLRALQ